MSPETFKIELNPSLGLPIYRQIMDGIRQKIAGGVLKPGDQLPSIRELSSRLRINPSSAVKAYSELQHAGVISLDHGRGTFVSEKKGLVTKSREEILKKEVQGLLGRARSMGIKDKDVLALLRKLSKS